MDMQPVRSAWLLHKSAKSGQPTQFDREKILNIEAPFSSPQEVPADDRLSTAQKASPTLSQRTLTYMLIAMCCVPVITIFSLWAYLPEVHEGQLLASVATEGLPGEDFYAVDYYDRPPFEGGFVIVRNDSDVEWSNMEIKANHFYQTYDFDVLKPGEERRYLLSKLITRQGHTFQVRYNRLKSIRIYARQPKGDRATFYQDFETGE
jgi:hypothetical protein